MAFKGNRIKVKVAFGNFYVGQIVTLESAILKNEVIRVGWAEACPLVEEVPIEEVVEKAVISAAETATKRRGRPKKIPETSAIL